MSDINQNNSSEISVQNITNKEYLELLKIFIPIIGSIIALISTIIPANAINDNLADSIQEVNQNIIQYYPSASASAFASELDGLEQIIKESIGQYNPVINMELSKLSDISNSLKILTGEAKKNETSDVNELPNTLQSINASMTNISTAITEIATALKQQ